MKKCILSAMAGAVAMLIAITVAAMLHRQPQQTYEHVDYVSAITSEDCFVCGNSCMNSYWGEDNVGIVNLNTFEFLRLEVNRLVAEPTGVMTGSSLSDKKTGSYVHVYGFPDEGYAHVQLSGVQYAIDRDAVESHLCQRCLDAINRLWFTDQPPAEFGIVSFADRTIRPLLNAYPWFSAGNYGVDCEFRENGNIRLLIHRFAQKPSSDEEGGTAQP